jgi:hypothetical protein
MSPQIRDARSRLRGVNRHSRVWYHILRQIDPPTPPPVDIPARKNPDLAARVSMEHWRMG